MGEQRNRYGAVAIEVEDAKLPAGQEPERRLRRSRSTVKPWDDPQIKGAVALLKETRDQWRRVARNVPNPQRLYAGLRGHGLKVLVDHTGEHTTLKTKTGAAVKLFDVWAVAPAGKLTPVFPKPAGRKPKEETTESAT